MIKLTKLNGEELYINPDLIDNMACHPNTTIILTTDSQIIVKESPDEVVNRIVEFKKRIYSKHNANTHE
ncbi:MAG: flagellar FlbD family protein [Elusimicrobia bacterium]|nr:flagellar FlbD family protein [Elusimicrobiota bacterium]